MKSSLKSSRMAAAFAGAAVMAIAGAAQAATVIDDLGVLGPSSTLAGSVIITRTASALKYKFGDGSSASQSSATGDLNLAFQFEVNTPITLIYADAQNPLNSLSNQLSAPSSSTFPYIYLYDATTSTDVTANPPSTSTSNGAFALTGPPSSYNAVTDTVTLQPGTYLEYIVARANSVEGNAKTDLNVGVFSGPGVPEPATWMMMIGGLGLMGMGLRLRRNTAPTFA